MNYLLPFKKKKESFTVKKYYELFERLSYKE